MAFDRHLAKYLGDKAKNKCVLTLGRLHNIVRPERVYLRSFDIDCIRLESMGIDESPTINWDLNLPVPIFYHDTFDIIIDGGTLEHVFNIPVALESITKMLRKGGMFITQQMCGISGHGFYNLSPELFWRWTEENGFVNQHCIAYRHRFFSGWKSIVIEDNKRDEIHEFFPHYFIFSAIKNQDLRLQFNYPQQAGPNMNPPRRFWLWDTKLWSRKSAT